MSKTRYFKGIQCFFEFDMTLYVTSQTAQIHIPRGHKSINNEELSFKGIG